MERFDRWTLVNTGTAVPYRTFLKLEVEFYNRFIWTMSRYQQPPEFWKEGRVLQTARDRDTGAVFSITFGDGASELRVEEFVGALDFYLIGNLAGFGARWETFHGTLWSRMLQKDAFYVDMKVIPADAPDQVSEDGMGDVELPVTREAGTGKPYINM